MYDFMFFVAYLKAPFCHLCFDKYHIHESYSKAKQRVKEGCYFTDISPQSPLYFFSVRLNYLTDFLSVMEFDGFIDLDAYNTIALRLKGDGRCYISTVSLLLPLNPIRKERTCPNGSFSFPPEYLDGEISSF